MDFSKRYQSSELIFISMMIKLWLTVFNIVIKNIYIIKVKNLGHYIFTIKIEMTDYTK
jgi:hypothetical protein